jgi:hypothetical protein
MTLKIGKVVVHSWLNKALKVALDVDAVAFAIKGLEGEEIYCRFCEARAPDVSSVMHRPDCLISELLEEIKKGEK